MENYDKARFNNEAQVVLLKRLGIPKLKHFVNTIPQPIRDEKELTPIENLCNIKNPAKHGISQMYESLMGTGYWPKTG